MSKAFTLIELPAVIATKVISKENYGLLQVLLPSLELVWESTVQLSLFRCVNGWTE